MAGYSGTPLAKKLGIKVGTQLTPIGAPAGYLSLLAPLPADVTMLSGISKKTDIIHLFVTSQATLSVHLQRCVGKMRADTAVWVSWPKKTAMVPTDLTEDVIRSVALPLGLVDIKVCAVDETWSGLKLVVRRENRAAWGPPAR